MPTPARRGHSSLVDLQEKLRRQASELEQAREERWPAGFGSTNAIRDRLAAGVGPRYARQAPGCVGGGEEKAASSRNILRSRSWIASSAIFRSPGRCETTDLTLPGDVHGRRASPTPVLPWLWSGTGLLHLDIRHRPTTAADRPDAAWRSPHSLEAGGFKSRSPGSTTDGGTTVSPRFP